MNDLEKHIQNLFDSLSNSNVDAAKSIVLDIVYLCGENLNPQTITFCLSLFFKREKNLLTFLRKTITRDEFRGCKVDLLQFLEKFITSAEKKILPYSPDIKDTCILLFSSDKYSDVRCATFSIISKILELTKGEYEITAKMNIPKLADDYFLSLANQSKLSSSIKANILSILGKICWYHPEVISSKSNKCLELFLNTLKNEINAKFRKSDLSLIAGALDGLNSYLNNFSVCETSDHLRAVFNFIKLSLLSSSDDLSRYAVPKSALNILIKHCRQFDELIYSDYKEIFDRISQWSEHKNYDMKKLAYLALDSYYKSLAEMIRVKSNTETDKCRLIFKYFIQKFYKNLTDGNKDLKEMVISIKGYGAFAGPCRELMETKDMKLMLNIIIDICDRNFLSADSAQHNEIYDEKIFQLSSFIESLSCVCSQIDSFSEGSLNTMEKLVILAIDCYPKLVKRYNNQISLAIASLFLAIQRTNFSDEFISRIIYHSLIRIFSYKTLYSVNQEDTSNETTEPMSSIIVTTSLDYVMLWSNFLGLHEFSDLKSENLDDKKKIVEIIFNEYIESIIKIMNKLDLAAVKNDGSEANDSEQENTEKNQSDLDVSSDPIIGLKPQKPRDFEIFINLVDFTRELLMNKNLDLFEKWLFKLSKEIILLSTSHCLISGFYKLATLIMKMAVKIGYFNKIDSIQTNLNTSNDSDVMLIEDCDDPESSMFSSTICEYERVNCFHLFKKYLLEVSIRMKQFKDELLVSCLEFFLSLPKEFVIISMDHSFHCLNQALDLGVNYLKLAEDALNSLEYWLKNIPTQLIKPYFPSILTKFENYLQASSNKSDLDSDEKVILLNLTHKGKGRKKLPVKLFDKNSLSFDVYEQIQLKILKILGQLSADMSHSVHLIDSEDITSWDTVQHLKFYVPFTDIKPTIYFDRFLPRVIHLAQNSPSRQTKINACELLHALVIYTIGKSVSEPEGYSQSYQMTKIYHRLYPCLFGLSCDTDHFVRNLFQPLVMQMIHWFTGNRKYESSDTIQLLGCIMESLVDEKNAALRDFSANCLKEFLKWSIKHTPLSKQENSAPTPVNAKSILKRIFNFLTHPNANKRLGACLAWNSVYTIFREEESIVNLHIFEILFYLIESLAMSENDDKMFGTQEQCKLGLDHVERIIKFKSDILNQIDPKRVKPPGWSEPVLEVAVRWLMRQCGRIETECRHKAMELSHKLAPNISGVKDIKDYFNIRLVNESEMYFLARFEGSTLGKEILKTSLSTYQSFLDLTGPKFQFSLLITWLKLLNAPLDCYTWIFGQRLLNPKSLFSTKKSCIWSSIEIFLDKVASFSLHNFLSHNYTEANILFSLNEIDEYNGLKCTVMIRLMDFLETIFANYSKESLDVIPMSLWNSNLYSLVINMTLNPTSLGFSLKNLEIFSNLSPKIRQFYKIVIQNLPTDKQNKFRQQCQQIILDSRELNLDFLVLKDIDWINLSQTIAGYEILSDFKIFKITTDMSKFVFDLSQEETESQTTTEAKRKLFSLCLSINRNFLTKILQDYLEEESANATLTYFRAEIFTQCLNFYSDILDFLFAKLSSKFSKILQFLINFVEFTAMDKHLRKTNGQKLIVKVFESWSKFEPYWSFESQFKILMISLLTKCLMIESPQLKNEKVFQMYFEFLTDDKSMLNFKAKVLDLLHFFTNSPKFKVSLSQFMSQLPLRSQDLAKSDDIYKDYLNVVHKLLVCLELSQNLDMLSLLIGVVCREKEHLCENQFRESLERFIKRLSSEKQMEIVKQNWSNFQSSDDERKFLLFEKVIFIFLKNCDKPVFIDFMSANIVSLIEVLNWNLNEPAFEMMCMNKKCVFQLIELAYKRLHKDEIFFTNAKICMAYENVKFGCVKDGKELTKEVLRKSRKHMNEYVNFNSGQDAAKIQANKDLERILHCSAYNCLISLFIRTQTEPKLYLAFLFKDDPSKNEFVFETLIDKSKSYNFCVEMENFTQRKTKFISIRDEFKVIKADTNSRSSNYISTMHSTSSLSTQNLYSSSLSEELSVFDFSVHSSYNQAYNSQSSMTRAPSFRRSYTDDELNSQEQSVEIELDELNQHESMDNLISLFQSLVVNKITPIYDNGQLPSEMPPWMTFVHKKILDVYTHENIKLFLIRAIANTESIFKPYCKFWYSALIGFLVNSSLCRDLAQMDCFTLDLMVMLLSWGSIQKPDQSEAKLINRLFTLLIKRCYHENRAVLKNNIELIKTMTECWRDMIQVPVELINNFLTSNDHRKLSTGIQLLGVVLSNGIENYEYPMDISRLDFFKSLINCIKEPSKLIHAPAAEVVGMLLKRFDSHDKEYFENTVSHLFEILREADTSLFITSIHKIQLNYAAISERFMTKLVFFLPQLYGDFKKMCAESILSSIRVLQDPLFKSKNFIDMLTHRDTPIQLICLKMIHETLDKQTDEDLDRLMPHLEKFIHHPHLSCRYQFVLILISLYEIYQFKVNQTGSASQILNFSKENLLKALIDEDTSIRVMAQNFWTEKADMPSNTIDRMLLIVEKLYSPKTEREFLSYSTNLLLEKTSKSPDYNRLIYENPLSECIFREYNLSADWRRRHEIMTPLFAETATNTFTESVDLRHNLRATQQTLQFQPTLKVYDWLTQSSIDTFTDTALIDTKSSLLFKTESKNKDSDEKEVLKLRRRFIKDKADSQSKFFARKQIAKKNRDEDLRKQLKAKRENHVEKYRNYRIGDFPDIQIKHSELIAPMQALAQRDSQIAMVLFESIFVSILSEISYLKDEQDSNKILKELTQYLNAMLASSESFNSNFIACILEICIKNPKLLKLDPGLVTSACLNSFRQSLGIILLEEYIIHFEEDSDAPVEKKVRLNPKDSSSEASILWIELAKLYRSMNDYDSIKGIFLVKSDLVCEHTERGIDFEAVNDYYSARNEYGAALDSELLENVSQSEQDLWLESLLKCCNELTDWKAMCEWSMNGNTLDQLFEDAYSIENVFPYAFRSKLKLILQEDENEQKKHKDLIKFINGLEVEKKKYLEQSFCQEMALISVHQSDLSAANYYAHLAIQKYLAEWSSTNKTIKQNQINKLQSLQSIVELNEFLKFINSNQAFTVNLAKKIDNLIDVWTDSMPNMQTDPPCTWDDVITNRSIFFEFIEEKYLNSVCLTDPETSTTYLGDSVMNDFDEDLSNYTKKLKKKMTKTTFLMKIRFAQAAQSQGNFKLSLDKLKQSRSILRIKNSDFLDLQLIWNHCYLNTHLNKCKQANSKESLESFFESMVLREILKSDSLSDTFKNNQKNHLYQEQRVLHSKFSKFLIESLMDHMNQSDFDSGLQGIITEKKHVLQLIDYVKNDDINDFEKTLSNLMKHGVDNLLKIKDSLKGSLELATYCDFYLRIAENDNNDFEKLTQISQMIKSQFPEIVTEQLFYSIRSGSLEARTRFPRLLQIIELYPDECLEKFVSSSEDIPSWMFLSWLSQMTALLDKPQAKAIQNIIENISIEYPQALVYPFRMSTENFKFSNELNEQSEFVQKISRHLNTKLPLVEQFITALEHLNTPKLFFNDLIMEINNNLKKNDITMKLFKDLNNNLIDLEGKIDFCGRLWTDFSNFIKPLFMKQFGEQFRLLPQLSELEIKNKLQNICSQVNEFCQRKPMSGNLGDYSAWLKSFKRNITKDIEIPGQYNGNEKPMPEYHVKIEGFDERILEMSSLRRPKCITIRGDDQREYKFLVKCGEDQRQDQRVEILLDIINNLLKSDSKCYQRNLSIKTYQVVPMTSKLALIEWLPETKPLKVILENDLVKEAQNNYAEFIYGINKDGSKKTQSEVYGMVYAKYSRDLICREFDKIQNSIPWDLFRQFLRTLSSDSEAYFVLRNEFIKSYAVASTCHYILGIGDRHLSNWMIDLKTGRAIGIDFGIAFGHATMNIPVPELVPIRLTRQILKLIAPLEQRGLFESSMVHCLKALRENNDLLVCILDVFIKEPSIDWIGSAVKIAKKNLNEDMEITLGLQYAKDRVNSVKQKLFGMHPSVIMRNDLCSGIHKDSKYLQYFVDVLMGNKILRRNGGLLLERSKILAENGEKYRLTIEEQVKCIIDQSTDTNILGRTWIGWQPFC